MRGRTVAAALAALLLCAAAPARALEPAPIDAGRTALAAGLGLPVHFAAVVGVLAFSCSGEVIEARCGRTIEGADGARAATYLLLATLPPLASGTVVWALGDDEAAPSSLPWTLAGGAAGQLLGFGLALALDSEAVAFLSLTAFPVAGETAALLLTRTAGAGGGARTTEGPPALRALAPGIGRPAPREALLVPVAQARF